MALFTPEQLGNLMQVTANAAAAGEAERVASGWLRSATGLTAWPSPVPDDIYGWALELGAAVYENPTGLQSLTVGSLSYGYGGERLKDIIGAATRRTGGGNSPGYSFPAPAWGETDYVTQ